MTVSISIPFRMTQPKSVSSKLVVLSIEIGAVWSSLAFSLKGTWKKVFTSRIQNNKEMLPTAVLLNPDKTFNSFGFEAKETYSALTEDEEWTDHSYFPDFMKQLIDFHEFCSSSPTIKDVYGTEVAAKELLSLSIEYFVDRFLSYMKNTVSGFCSKDMDVVLVLPCQCNSGLQNFMKDAALTAGLEEDQICLVPTSVSASLFYEHLSKDETDYATAMNGGFSLSTLVEKSMYLSVHIGEENTTICVHLKCAKGIDPVLKTIVCPKGLNSIVCKVTSFLKYALGDNVIEELENDCPEEYAFLIESILQSTARGKPTTTIPHRLISVTQNIHGKSFSEVLESKFEDRSVSSSSGRIKISLERRNQFLLSTLERIIDEIEKIKEQESLLSIQGIIFSGKLANYKPLQEFLKTKLKSKITIFEDASSIVQKGAVYYGHVDKTKNIVASYTYGIQFWEDFDSTKHPEVKKITIGGKEYCGDVFYVFVAKGDMIPAGRLIKHRVRALNPKDEIFRCLIFRSQMVSPTFVDSPTCHKIGLIEVPFSKIPADCYEETEVTMRFDFSCLSVEAQHIYKTPSFKVSLFETDCIAC